MASAASQSSPSPRWSRSTVLLAALLGGAAAFVVGYRSQSAPSRAVDRPVTARSAASLPPATPFASEPLGSDSLEARIAALSPAQWQNRWQEVRAQPSTPARNRELQALIEQLAKRDPQQALQLAQAEANWRWREHLRDAALKGWASVAPDAAGEWALGVRVEDRRQAVAAVLNGAAENPPEAVRVALRLCAADPEPAGDYGHAAIAALVNTSAFAAAAKFSLEVGAEKYPFLLKSAFYQWAHHDPKSALAAIDGISDPLLRSQAHDHVLAGWAKADAKALAEHALALPTEDLRARALSEALPHWLEKDPILASDWIARHDSGAAFDDGTVAMANRQSLIANRPTVAMELAGNIADPAKRSHTMRAVFRQWADKDASAARRYLESTRRPEDRALLLGELKDLHPEG